MYQRLIIETLPIYNQRIKVANAFNCQKKKKKKKKKKYKKNKNKNKKKTQYKNKIPFNDFSSETAAQIFTKLRFGLSVEATEFSPVV